MQRVLPLAPDVTELVFALGGAGLVPAVPRSADFPPEVTQRPSFNERDLEAIVAQRPDVVVATTAGTDLGTVERLRTLGIPVATVDVTSFERLVAACRWLGQLLGRAHEGELLASSLAARIEMATTEARALPLRTALYVVWWDPLIVAAPGTFHHDLLQRARLHNLAPAGAGRYPRANPELLLDPRLDVLVAPDEPSLRAAFKILLERPEGRRAARGALAVVWLPADPASRPGPRLVDALSALLAARKERP